ncbi:MAG: sigma-70 family RNA polymerase sigma factor [Patescibacteria group bacterium]|nr:sigma-70 family RNA polymerase sigma factor [Patescibacteria group bacterium]
MQKNIVFEKIYKENYPKILNFIKSKTSTVEDAEDITSGVFEKAFKGLDNFKWQGIPVSSWLYKIAKNSLIDFYRKKKDSLTTEKMLEIKGPRINSEQDIMSNLCFEQIVNSLKPRERKIIYMKFFEGHTNKNIAKKLKLTENNVAIIIHRTIKDLRKALI